MFSQGYWPREMSEADRARSMEDFTRAIYPIWRGIDERDRAEDAKKSLGECMAQPIMAEVVTLHKQDLAIYESGHKPSKISTAPESMQRLRQKAAAGEKFSGWRGGQE